MSKVKINEGELLHLTLETGEVIEAKSFTNVKIPEEGIEAEMVFLTAMSGYVEALTDPSYAEQALLFTMPHIGNYGVNYGHKESSKIWAKAMICNEYSPSKKHWSSTESLQTFLEKNQILGIEGVDTRKLTKLTTSRGSVSIAITPAKSMARPDFSERVKQTERETHPISLVSTKSAYQMPGVAQLNLSAHYSTTNYHMVVLDFGVKKSILRELNQKGIDLTILPFNTSLEEIASYSPDGILLSNGPGDPKQLLEQFPEIKETLNELVVNYPVLAICMGHQLLSLTLGADTHKMKFGNRGANHSVIDLSSHKVFITSQNHSYAVIPPSSERSWTSPQGLQVEVAQINLNDDSIEAIRVLNKPIICVQYHPEANPGPHDTHFLFDEFFQQLKSTTPNPHTLTDNSTLKEFHA